MTLPLATRLAVCICHTRLGLVTGSALLIAGGSLCSLHAEEQRLLTHPGQVWALPSEEKVRPQQFLYEGTVYYFDPFYRLFWLEDEGETSFVPLARDPPGLRQAQRVRIEGTLIPDEGLSARTARVTILEESASLKPLDGRGRINEVDTLSGRIVTVQAYVDDQQEIDPEHWRLRLIVEGRPVICWVRTDGWDEIPEWEGHFVEVTGLYSSKFDPTNTKNMVELWVEQTGKNLRILESAEDSEFFTDPRLIPIAEIPTTPIGTLIKITGEAQQHEAGSHIVVRDSTGQIVVQNAQSRRVPYGTRIEAVGYVAQSGSQWRLVNTLFRKVPPSPSEKAEDTSAVYKRIESIRQLNLETIEAGQPVDISGVVVWSEPGYDYFFLHDVSGSIRVYHDRSFLDTPPLAKYLRILGKTRARGMAPAVELQDYVDLGAMSAPEARPITLEQAMLGREDGQWVEMQGFLREVKTDGDYRWIHVTTPTGEFITHLQSPVWHVAEQGSLISVRGACDTTVDAFGQVTEVIIRSPFIHDIDIIEGAPADFFDLPLSTVSGLRQLSTVRPLSRARIKGIVLHHVPGYYISIQDGPDTIVLHSRDTTPLNHGDLIEAVGILGREGVRTILRETVYRKIGYAGSPLAAPIQDPAQIQLQLEGQLVSTRGTLIDLFQRPGATRLTLQSGEHLVEAILHDPDQRFEPLDLLPGSGIEVTGLYRVDFDDARRQRGFFIQLRTPDDAIVFRNPRLWTVQRALMFSSILGGSTLLGIAWVVALRRRVKRQTLQIRQQLEKELALEERNRSIVEDASDFIFTASLDGSFTSFNQAGERITGFTQAEANSLNLRDIFPDQNAIRILLCGEPDDEQPGALTFQSPLQRKDGSTVWVETSARLLGSESASPRAILGIVRDISERKEIEEELKRARDAAETSTRAKSQFLANMSHEIRTPMNAVIGMSDLMLGTRLNPRQREFAETIRNGADALLTILNDILDFSKIEAEQMELETINFDLRDTLEKTAELLASKAAEKGLELSVYMPPETPSRLRGDPGRLRQILLNILGNAIKFTEEGSVLIKATSVGQIPGRARIRFEVRDTGIGIPKDVIPRLFQPFSQADSSTTRKFGGTGLGLAIARQIIELMGGRYGVESEVGVGSKVWCEIPLQTSSSNLFAQDSIPMKGFQNRTVLVLSNQPTNTLMLESYIHALGAQIHVLPDAAQAIDECVKWESRFDAIVLDHVPGKLHAVKSLLALRKAPALKSTPAIVLASVQEESFSDLMEPLQILARIGKPVRFAALSEALVSIFIPGAIPPAKARLQIDSGESEEAPISQPDHRTPLKVLLAEDNPVNQRVAILLLERFGHHCVAANNGLEVLDCLQKETFDLILMDCQMPEMDGFACTHEIRQRYPELRTPIIALTANAMQGDRERCLQAGMDDYIAKPMRIPDLQAMLRSRFPLET